MFGPMQGMFPNYGGLLGQDDQAFLRNQGLLGMAGNLLAASGPSPTRTSFVQALGQGLQGMQQSQSQAMQGLLNQKLLGAKLQEAEADKKREAGLQGLVGRPGGLLPNDAQGDEMIQQPGTGLLGGQISPQQFYAGVAGLGGDYGKQGLKAMLPHPDGTPSNVREWQYFNSLPKDQQEQFLRMKRADKFLDVGSGYVTPNPANPTQTRPVADRNLKPSERPGYFAEKEKAEAKGKAEAEAQITLSTSLDEVQKMRDSVNGLLNSPGFDTIYGASGKLDPRNLIPGTDASNASARRDQLDAMSFGMSIQKMRGMGALSDAEGKKVSAAYTRATSPKISEEEARKAWTEVLGYLDTGEKRLRERAGQKDYGLPKKGADAEAEIEKRKDTKYGHLF